MPGTDVPGVGEYGGPAGGWGALQAVAKAVRGEMSAHRATIMLQVNQPYGFDCPGCAWPDPREGSSFEFCENGAKAVAWEATNKRVTPEDLHHCDAIFSFGHNPGTNHPRKLATSREASLRHAPIVVFNPLEERSLERFKSPQSPVEMTVGRAVPIASHYYRVRIGGDAALIKGLMKAMDAAQLAAGGNRVLDVDFIAAHTTGFEALVADLDATSWDEIEAIAGLSRADIETAAGIHARAERPIVCYGMGITQHRHGTGNVQQLANLLLLRGNIGKEGAGICPLLGHSNVQGDRTVGTTEIPSQALLDGLERVFGIQAPRRHGHGAVAAIEAMRDGRSKALTCLGGNLPTEMPYPRVGEEAMRKLDLSVHFATKLNRSHLMVCKNTFLLPCLGRTVLDVQETGPQSVTVEDSISMVHASRGTLPPASTLFKSEPAIVAGIAKATLRRAASGGKASHVDRREDAA